MIRRGVAALVLVGFIASQLAAIPHTHHCADAEHHNHDARPHFHWGAFASADRERDPHAHAHPHSHGHAGLDRAGRDAPEQPVDVAGFALAPPPSEHDCDAVFLPDLGLSAAPRGVVSPLTAGDWLPAAAGAASAASCGARAAIRGRAHPPDDCLTAGDLFVALHKLLL